MTLTDADGNLVGRTVPYADGDPATPLQGDEADGTLTTPDGDVVGRTALYQITGGTAVPVTSLGGTASDQVTADAPLVATPSGDNVTLSVTTDQAGGVPVLDGSGLVKLAQMPISGLNYHGNWDASANTPVLADGSGAAGDMYRVHVAGSQDLGSGSITFDVGDLVVYEGAQWQKFAAATGVISVNGQTGAVSLAAADVSALPTAGGTMTGPIHMGEQQINNLGDAASARDAVNLETMQSAVGAVDVGVTSVTGSGVIDAIPTTGDAAVSLTPGNDGQVLTTSGSNVAWADPAPDAPDTAWGSITGTLSDQTDLDTALGGKLATSGGTMSGPLNMGSNKVTDVATPTTDGDAATKSYVDGRVSSGHSGGIYHYQLHHLTNNDHIQISDTSATVQLVDTNGSTSPPELKLPANPSSGRYFYIKRTMQNDQPLTITPQPGAYIDSPGSTPVHLTNPGDAVQLYFDAYNWQTIASHTQT